MTGAEILARCQTLARFTETPGVTTRTFLCPAMHHAHRTLRQWMEEASLAVTVDAAGNLRGLYGDPHQPRLLLASHIDTVPNAGAYDGVLGVVLAIALVRSLDARALPFAIEVVAFSEEEGVRFGVPFLGSRALTGTLDETLLARTDASGVSVAEAIRAFGLDPSQLPAAKLAAPPLAYLEFHIEQGPVLDSLNLPLAVVTAIAGQSRYELAFHGSANHAGTTPMNLRRDALAAAARWVATVERHARSVPGLVATVGTLRVQPGAANVIPGEVTATLDIRHAEDAVRHSSAALLLRAAEALAARRGIQVSTRQRSDQPAVPCATAVLERALLRSGHPLHRMPSGAGHDAMILASVTPAAMLFLRSPKGLSHHPDEAVHPADVDAALTVGRLYLEELERAHA